MKEIKTVEEQLTSLKKMNKTAREIYAKKKGFNTSKEYITHLQGTIGVSTIPLVTVHVVDLLDCSGSMSLPYISSKINGALTAINEGVRELSKDEKVNFTHTFITFSGKYTHKTVHIGKNPKYVSNLEAFARGGTALNDAIVYALINIEEHRSIQDKVLLNIYTDGEENDSTSYSKSQVSALIELYSTKGYTITFIGTEEDTKNAVKDFGIHESNTLSYNGTAEGLEKSMKIGNTMRTNYASLASTGADVSKGFFKNIN
jgi:uncharacterized protein YegL